MYTLARQFRSTEAAEIAEAALVLPLVFLFLLGIIWFGRAFNIYSTIQQAAQQGALAAARPTCATCGNTVNSAAAVSTVVENVMKASNLSPSQIIAKTPSSPTFCASPYPAGSCTTAGDNVTVCSNVLLNPPASTTQPQVCGSLVTFQYPFTFNLPLLSLQVSTVTLSAQAQSRMEN
ncbi:MAG: TadE/TadG family type IV pilus assembly protein [Terriglobales bacterium]|jgi:Flp pilus assembly protein TadG